ncbi:MAG: PHP domain-containing protein [Syntrophales bacterium]
MGCELNFLPDGRMGDKPHTNRALRRVVVLAENNTGYHNLIKLTSAAYLESAYKFPCVDNYKRNYYHMIPGGVEFMEWDKVTGNMINP